MGRKRQNEVQFVVDNKHLLSLFFIAVLFFSLFFSWGYTIGYGHGETTESTELAALNETPGSASEEGMLPRTLLEEPPKIESVIAPKIASKPTAGKDAGAKPSAVKKPAKPEAPAPKAVAQKPAPKTADKGLHLQVAALRVNKDAQALVNRLNEKGYAAAVHESSDRDWFRVVVGPFGSTQEAENIREKLGKDGFAPMVRWF